MSNHREDHRHVTRRGLLGASAAVAGAWSLGAGVSGAAPAHAAEPSFDERVRSLRAQFFSGPIADRIDLDSLDPSRRPDSTQIGTIGHLDRQFVEKYPWMTLDNMLPFAVAAGIKWLRTGLVYQDWDWYTNTPTESVRQWVTAYRTHGIRPLFTVNNKINVGTPNEVSGTVDLVRGAVAQWGEDVGAFMFDNEPGNGIWKRHYGGTYAGGPWVEPYSRFVAEGSQAIKAEHPSAFLVNAIQVEQVAMAQLKQSSPLIDALCMHHYTYRHGIPPEYDPHTVDPKFRDFATSDPEFERSMHDYLRQARMLLRDPGLQLWMTEVGIPSLSHREYQPDTLEPMSRTQQAKTVARMLILGLLTTAKTFVYCLADQGHSPARDNDNYGLVTDKVTAKPAFFVVGRISALTGGRATPDPEFQAVVTRIDGPALPMYVKQVGSHLTRLVKEQVRAERFTTADGGTLVAIWSTAPPREEFAPRRTTFALNKSLDGQPLLVDPMTGSSEYLPAHPGPGGTQTFTVDVPDYPVFLVGG